jgi:hypothetical protein
MREQQKTFFDHKDDDTIKIGAIDNQYYFDCQAVSGIIYFSHAELTRLRDHLNTLINHNEADKDNSKDAHPTGTDDTLGGEHQSVQV